MKLIRFFFKFRLKFLIEGDSPDKGRQLLDPKAEIIPKSFEF